MNWLKNKSFYFLIFVAAVFTLFIPVVLKRLPFPSDTLLGLYHPWRDVVWDNLDAGVPFKNPLITDPARQQYPYKKLALSLIKKGEIPLWNPYAFSGTPLLANLQAGIFYPLNILFSILPFPISWTILVILQQLLAGIFFYAYLRYFKLDRRACVLGALAFSFSGFFIAWLTWNTVVQVALWLPLILLAKEKLIDKITFQRALLLIFAESSMIFAGHPQTTFYILGFSTAYLIGRIFHKRCRARKLVIFSLIGLVVIFFTSIQTIPTLRFILLSARNFDLPNWHRSDWFLPWQHLIQLVAPDFFGSPATGNYWGVWNYGEFASYIGIFPLLMAMFALGFRRDKKTLFFGSAFFVSLFLALPTPLAKLPYQLHIPFISTMQPSRIIVLIDFSLAVLTALGFDYLLKKRKQTAETLILFLSSFALLFAFLWGAVLFGGKFGFSDKLVSNLMISKRNLILPTGFFLVSLPLLYLLLLYKNKKLIRTLTILLLFLIAVLDLLRFGSKFTPFVKKDWIYPSTKSIRFLQENLGNYRFMTTDRRLFPPNVATYYRLQDVSGYDPLYLKNYGELVAAWIRNKSDITPASFNRILTPERVDSFFPDLLGVKYVLSLEDLENKKLKLVFQEGETRVYENNAVFPRAFLVEEMIMVENKQKMIEKMFEERGNLLRVAVIGQAVNVDSLPLSGDEFARILSYSENSISIQTKTKAKRLLVLTDIYYPTWHVFIDGKESDVFPVDYAFRGVVVPQGKHMVEFQARPL